MTSMLDWPQRPETVVYNLHDDDGTLLGSLMVSTDDTPSVTNDTSRSIRRAISRISVPPRPLYDRDESHFYAEDINPLSMMVKPYWVVGETPYPLGVFVWGDDSQVQWSGGSPRLGSLTDLCTLIDQPIENSIGYGQGTSVRDAIIDVLADNNVPNGGVEGSGATFGVAVGWVAGRDTVLTVLDGLCKNAGFLPPYFDNAGLLQCRSAPDLTSATPDFTYGYGTSVVPGSAVFSNDLLTAPNRYVVVGGNPDAELVGTFDIPAAAPNSFAETGRIRRKTDTVQGISTQAQANQAAAAAYATDISSYSWLSFDARVDPRHDTWNIVRYDGINYREVGWTIECKPGGKMSHQLRGTYT